MTIGAFAGWRGFGLIVANSEGGTIGELIYKVQDLIDKNCSRLFISRTNFTLLIVQN